MAENGGTSKTLSPRMGLFDLSLNHELAKRWMRKFRLKIQFQLLLLFRWMNKSVRELGNVWRKGEDGIWAAPNGAVSFLDFKRDPGRGCYNSWSELRDTAGLVSAWVTSQLPASNFEMPAHRKQNMWYLIVISEPSMMERSDSAVVSFFWLWQNDVIMMFIISFISYFIIVIIKPIFFGTDRIRRSFSGRKQ